MAAKGFILMLEPDEHDRELSKSYFSSHAIPCEFLRSSDEVFTFLKNNKELPSLILLSMNTSPLNGLETLKQIKAQDELRHIPVIILGEDTQTDLIKLCYANGASTFIKKPFGNQATDLAIRSFIQYWFVSAELPSDLSTVILTATNL